MKIMINQEKLTKSLKRIISDVAGCQLKEITDNVNLRNELSIDSFTATEILVLIEKEFDITIRLEDLYKIETFKDVTRIVSTYI